MTERSPCDECPFRRTSIRGWIGGHKHPSEITNLIHIGNLKFPCHKKVNAIKETGRTFEEAVERAPHCTGALIHMNLSCKVSNDPAIYAEQKKVGQNEEVFRFPHEFIEHHTPNTKMFKPRKKPSTSPTKRKRKKA